MAVEPKHVLITGAAGNIGYAILPLIATGNVFGPQQPLILHLLDIPACEQKLQGVLMELEDCAFPLVIKTIATTDPRIAFKDLDVAFLIGSFPRGNNMERKELLAKNAAIFKEQGAALDKYSKKSVRVLVVGNPANTNALIAQRCAPSIPKQNFSSMTRLDHNRALGMLARKCNVDPSSMRNVIIWGNHSSTQVPDPMHAVCSMKSVPSLINDQKWLESDFVTAIQKRGAAVIQARGLSSALSAAVAAVDHMHDWIHGTKEGEFVSMAIPSDGSYNIQEGIIFSYPVTIKDGKVSIVQGLKLTPHVQAMMEKTHNELLEEREEAFNFLQIN